MATMLCPKCGGATRVANCRTADANAKNRNTGPARRADRAVGWFTPDWVGRDRRCTRCGDRFFTVEIPIEDLAAGWVRRIDDDAPG